MQLRSARRGVRCEESSRQEMHLSQPQFESRIFTMNHYRRSNRRNSTTKTERKLDVQICENVKDRAIFRIVFNKYSKFHPMLYLTCAGFISFPDQGI